LVVSRERVMMKIKLQIIIIVSAILTGGISLASDINNYNFHGLVLGISEKSLMAKFPEFSCKDDDNLELRRCEAPFKLENRSGVMSGLLVGDSYEPDVYLTYKNDKLVNINIIWYASMFDTAIKSFKEYYGDPFGMDSKKFKTKGGKTHNNKTYIWNKGKESIIYTKHYDHEQRSRILYIYNEGENQSTINNKKYSKETLPPSNKETELIVLTNKLYRTAFSGKTVSGRHSKKGFKFKDYFGEDGTLIEVRDNGKRKKGNWTIDDDNTLCIIWKSKKACGQLEQVKDGSFSFSRNDDEKRRYKSFEDGNTLE